MNVQIHFYIKSILLKALSTYFRYHPACKIWRNQRKTNIRILIIHVCMTLISTLSYPLGKDRCLIVWTVERITQMQENFNLKLFVHSPFTFQTAFIFRTPVPASINFYMFLKTTRMKTNSCRSSKYHISSREFLDHFILLAQSLDNHFRCLETILLIIMKPDMGVKSLCICMIPVLA